MQQAVVTDEADALRDLLDHVEAEAGAELPAREMPRHGAIYRFPGSTFTV